MGPCRSTACRSARSVASSDILTPLQKFKFPVSRPLVDAEIALERENPALLIDLGTSDETCVSERDGPIRILLQERLDVGPVRFGGDCDAVHATCSKCHNVWRARGVHLPHKEACLSHNRFTTAE